jgi:hypothetical protein
MKCIVQLISLAILGGLLCTPVPAEEPRKPRYEGKPLSYWIERLQKCENNVDRCAAAEAIKAFGPDAVSAVPALVEMLDDRSEELGALWVRFCVHLAQ